MTTEIWEKIEGWGRYNVSNFGNVKNIESGKTLKPHPCGAGYTSVVLTPTCAGDYRRFRCHRLVALAFLPNPNNLPDVDHIYRVTINNHVSNLRWVTKKQNAANRRNRIVGNKHRRSVWKCDKKTGERIELFESMSLAAKTVTHKSKYPESFIGHVARGDHPSAYGYKWEFDDEEEIEGEVWREVDPFLVNQPNGEKTNYYISDMGRLRQPSGLLKLPHLNAQGYGLFSVMGHGFLAHRLIAFTFLKRIPGKDYVNHIDGDKTNCSLSNLEFVTQSENSIHAFETGLNLRVTSICQYELSGKFVQKYLSMAEASRQMKVAYTGIVKALSTGRTYTGYQWRVYENSVGDINSIVPYRAGLHILQYTISGEFVQEFNSASDASKEMGVTAGSIQQVVDKEGRTSAKHQWRNKYSNIPVTDVTNRMIHIKQISMDGNTVTEYSSAKQASKNTGFKAKGILTSSKTGKPYKGYKWVRVEKQASNKRKRDE